MPHANKIGAMNIRSQEVHWTQYNGVARQGVTLQPQWKIPIPDCSDARCTTCIRIASDAAQASARARGITRRGRFGDLSLSRLTRTGAQDRRWFDRCCGPRHWIAGRMSPRRLRAMNVFRLATIPLDLERMFSPPAKTAAWSARDSHQLTDAQSTATLCCRQHTSEKALAYAKSDPHRNDAASRFW